MISRLSVFGFVVLGFAALAHGQDAPEAPIPDNDRSPYHTALLDYKEGNYQEAFDALNSQGDAPLDTRTAILKSRVLTELKKFDEGEKVLRAQLAGPDTVVIQSALGDLLLRKRSFARAMKYYQAVLKATPNDLDVTLKLIYAEIGAGDFVDAGQLASQMTPLDPKNKYDVHAAYYFAQAAIAQSAGRTQEAQDQIQTARTNCGVTTTNSYLKTYLQMFESSGKNTSTDITPGPRAKGSVPAKVPVPAK